jgi:hypothetical protein
MVKSLHVRLKIRVQLCDGLQSLFDDITTGELFCDPLDGCLKWVILVDLIVNFVGENLKICLPCIYRNSNLTILWSCAIHDLSLWCLSNVIEAEN